MEGTTTQQQTNPSSLKPKIKRYPVNYSSDEYDEDDNIFNEQQKPREKEKSVENIFGGRVEQQGGGGIGLILFLCFYRYGPLLYIYIQCPT